MKSLLFPWIPQCPYGFLNGPMDSLMFYGPLNVPMDSLVPPLIPQCSYGSLKVLMGSVMCSWVRLCPNGFLNDPMDPLMFL